MGSRRRLFILNVAVPMIGTRFELSARPVLPITSRPRALHSGLCRPAAAAVYVYSMCLLFTRRPSNVLFSYTTHSHTHAHICGACTCLCTFALVQNLFSFFSVFVLCAVRLTFSRSLTLSGGLFLWVWGRRRSTCGVPHIFIMIAKRRCERVRVCVCATAKMGPPFGECESVCWSVCGRAPFNPAGGR